MLSQCSSLRLSEWPKRIQTILNPVSPAKTRLTEAQARYVSKKYQWPKAGSDNKSIISLQQGNSHHRCSSFLLP
jgi:hypothetical protein